MAEEMLKEGFGNRSNYYECRAACPKDIKGKFIKKLNRESMKGKLGLRSATQLPRKAKGRPLSDRPIEVVSHPGFISFPRGGIFPDFYLLCHLPWPLPSQSPLQPLWSQ
jgi:hypothetical protein